MVEPDSAALACRQLEQIKVVADAENMLWFDLLLCKEAFCNRAFSAHEFEHVSPIELYQRALQRALLVRLREDCKELLALGAV